MITENYFLQLTCIFVVSFYPGLKPLIITTAIKQFYLSSLVTRQELKKWMD